MTLARLPFGGLSCLYGNQQLKKVIQLNLWPAKQSGTKTDGNFKMPRAAMPLKFTGERMTPESEGQIQYEHYHRYCVARDFCAGRDVLDVASGEGYGSALLAGVARSVIGVEIDDETVTHASANYIGDNLRFLRGDALALPIPSESIDIAVSFETLEHVADHDRLFDEIRRVLRPGGLFLVSTPDRTVYSAPGSDPNPYHVLELTDAEFRTLLQSKFVNYSVFAQRPMLGSILASQDVTTWRSYERRGADIIEATNGLARAHYLVAIATDGPLPEIRSSAFFDWRRVHDVVEGFLRLPAAEAIAAELNQKLHVSQAEQKHKLDVSQQHARRLSAAIQETGQRLRAVESGRNAAESRLQMKLGELEHAWASYFRKENDLILVDNDRSIIRAHADQIRAHADHMTEAFAAALTELGATREAAGNKRRELEEQLASAIQARDAIVYSTSWRLLAPLRRFGQRYPALVRMMSRSVKLAWWTLTLQLPGRYKKWRHRQPLPSGDVGLPPVAQRSVPGIVEERVDTEVEPYSSAQDKSSVQDSPEIREPSFVDNDLSAPEESSAPPVIEQAPLPLDLRKAFLASHGNIAIDFPAVSEPVVSVVIPVYRGLGDLETCLRSLVAHLATEPSFEVIVVDDCPDDPVISAIPDSDGLLKITNSENLGFLRTCNKAAAVARGQFLCFLNADTIVSGGWLRPLVEALQNVPGTAIAGGMLLNTDGTIQEAGWCMLRDGWGHPIGRGCDSRDGAFTYRRIVDCVTGACFVIARQIFRELDGFDQRYAPAFYEEFDLAFRCKSRGLKVVYEPRSKVVHLGSASYGIARRDQLSELNHRTFVEQFSGVLHKQPADARDEFAVRHAMGAGPVILVIDDGVPEPTRHAGAVTISGYLSMLAAAGWRVVFGPASGKADGPAAEALESQGIELIRAPRTIDGWLSDNGAHVREVWIARPEVAEQLLGSIRKFTAAHVVYYPHDLHYLRLEREAEIHGNVLLRAEAARMWGLEMSLFRRVDHVTSPSEDEAAVIRRLAPDALVTTIPPYYYDVKDIVQYDADHFRSLSDVVFVGGFPHNPNVDAALFMANEVMPIVWRVCPDARLVLVGYDPPLEVRALSSSRVVVTGQVPKVEPYLGAARVVLAALRYGAGVKGKTVDALRLGVPVVTTAVGAEGIGIEHGRDAIVVEGAEALANGVLELLGDAERCAALSAAGAALIKRRFSRAAARNAIGKVFKTSRCGVCGSDSIVTPPTDADIREARVCDNCSSLGRTEAVGRVCAVRLGLDGEESLFELMARRPALRLHEFGPAGGIADTLRGFPGFTTSEHLDGVQLGERGPSGVLCEDMTQLTFDDDCLDLVITQDLMGYVSDPERGFSEIHRVLRPGGSHIFTTRQDHEMRNSLRRARLGTYGIDHSVPGIFDDRQAGPYHGLLFTEFGADLSTMVEKAGFVFSQHDVRVPGGDGEQSVRVFQAVKPSANRSVPT
jgi:GT2 family glycosyltransferase/SAM-dependent methyltransferase/glycosyltransferase involved in cell wall biosynthesis